MGKWAKRVFGREQFESVGIVVAGTNSVKFQKNIMSMFDEVISSKDLVYHAFLAKKDGRAYAVVFNVYGSSAMVDVITEMHDGGCRTVVFVGYAYGFKGLPVGSVVLPEKAYHFDGLYHHIEPDRKAAFPDDKLRKRLKEIFEHKRISYSEGKNISVPAVTFQLSHNNPTYKSICPATVEMELAACLSRSKDLGMRASGILIISDNNSSSIIDVEKRALRKASKKKVLELIIHNLDTIVFERLSVKKEFVIDEHLASIIEMPEDTTNIYRR